MTDLLRMANEIMMTHTGCMNDPCGHFRDAREVIHDYQDLLRRIVDVCEHSDYQPDLQPLIDEAKLSIPEVRHE